MDRRNIGGHWRSLQIGLWPEQAVIRSDLGHRGQIRIQHIAAEPIADELAFPNRFHQTGGFKLLHVVRECGGRHLAFASQTLARKPVAGAADGPEQFKAARVGQSAGNEVKMIVGESLAGHITMLEGSDRQKVAGQILARNVRCGVTGGTLDWRSRR